jgi:hypothetical protein
LQLPPFKTLKILSFFPIFKNREGLEEYNEALLHKEPGR